MPAAACPGEALSRRLMSRCRLHERKRGGGFASLSQRRPPNLAIRRRRGGNGNSGAELQPLFGILRYSVPPVSFDRLAPSGRAVGPAGLPYRDGGNPPPPVIGTLQRLLSGARRPIRRGPRSRALCSAPAASLAQAKDATVVERRRRTDPPEPSEYRRQALGTGPAAAAKPRYPYRASRLAGRPSP